MPRFKVVLPIALATLSATAFTAISVAQAANPAGPVSSDNSYTQQSQPAPIERGPYSNGAQNGYPRNAVLAPGQTLTTKTNVATSQPAPGIFVRVGQNSSVRAVAETADHTELSVEHGLANISLYQPAQGAQILVDLPGGQISLLKDGLYTFNADTNTVRVLHGEADAYLTSNSGAKPLKVKSDHAVTFNGARLKSVEFEPFQGRIDLIGGGNAYAGNGGYGYAPYGYGPYGDGFYGNPYYAYGYPYGYPYWGYGYPFGFGIGFGYYGGFGGGFGGFRGGGFGGRR